jgi:hypothetical protein
MAKVKKIGECSRQKATYAILKSMGFGSRQTEARSGFISYNDHW